ncbi:MAG TPA: hypothetical protein VFS44_14490 [Gemmatimonadaceae bacterium]|nr:hypothetical protein [Gemmatimonadaceae bacterium]
MQQDDRDLRPREPGQAPADTNAIPPTPYEVLLGELDHLLAEWRAMVRPHTDPSLPSSRLMNSMPEILPHLLRLARMDAPEVDDELKERIARDHGGARREDEVPVTVMALEWDALKRACALVLARHGIVGEEAEEALRRVDTLIDDAIGYTLRGYYQPELDTLRGRGLERRAGERTDRRGQSGDRRGRPADA